MLYYVLPMPHSSVCFGMKPRSLLSLYVLSTAYERPSYSPDVLLSAPPSSLHKPGHISWAPPLLHSQLSLHRYGQLHAVTQHWPSGRLWHRILRRCSQIQTLSCYKAQNRQNNNLTNSSDCTSSSYMQYNSQSLSLTFVLSAVPRMHCKRQFFHQVKGRIFKQFV